MNSRFATLGRACIALAVACSSSSNGGSTSSSVQKLAVGSPCTQDSDCGSAPFMCMLDHPGGYCLRNCNINNGDSDCPSESVCQFEGMVGECHLKCNSQRDCRT